MILLLITVILSGFLITYGSIPAVVNVSKVKKLFDVPNTRKLNHTAIPTLGGVGIFIGFFLSSLLFYRGISPVEVRYLFAAIVMMFFIGLKDDMLIIAPKKKFLIQLAAALILVLPGYFRIDHSYGILQPEIFSSWFSIPVSVLIILLLVNAINLIDGIDGLAAGLALLISLALGTWFFLAGHENYAILCAALTGTLIAFLRFNLFGGKNKTFMGDTGSLMLGIFLAAIAIKFNELNANAVTSVQIARAPLLVLALFIVPVTDTFRVFAIRIRNKRSPFSADMNHFHHVLIRLGLSHIQATSFLLAYTVFFTALAFVLSRTSISVNISFPFILVLSFGAVGAIWYLSQRAVQKRQSATEKEKTNEIKLVLEQQVIRKPGIIYGITISKRIKPVRETIPPAEKTRVG